jgi:hypothetical protein
VKVDEEGSRRGPHDPYASQAAGLARLRLAALATQGVAARRNAVVRRNSDWEDDATVGGVYVPSRMHFLPQWSCPWSLRLNTRGLLGDCHKSKKT